MKLIESLLRTEEKHRQLDLHIQQERERLDSLAKTFHNIVAEILEIVNSKWADTKIKFELYNQTLQLAITTKPNPIPPGTLHELQTLFEPHFRFIGLQQSGFRLDCTDLIFEKNPDEVRKLLTKEESPKESSANSTIDKVEISRKVRRANPEP